MQQVWYSVRVFSLKERSEDGLCAGRLVSFCSGMALTSSSCGGGEVLWLLKPFFFLLSFTVVCVLVQSGCQTAPADGIFFSRHLGKHSRLVFRDQERESVAWMLKNLNFFTISKETLLMCHEQLSSLFSQHLGRYYNLTTDGSLTSLLRSLLSLIRTVDMVPCKCHSAIMKYGYIWSLWQKNQNKTKKKLHCLCVENYRWKAGICSPCLRSASEKLT